MGFMFPWHSADIAENMFREHRTAFGLGYNVLPY
jgi:hypothetical protein